MNQEPSYIGPLVRESTPSIIADKLRDAISHGELAPGTQLFEAQLAAQLGVSRGPLREGMQRLAQEGLLISIRNRGVFVIEMTAQNVADMYLARSAIERAAAAALVARDPAPARAQMLAVVEEMRKAARRKDIEAVGDCDIEFHRRLVELAHSPRLSRIHRTQLAETRLCIRALRDTYRRKDTRVGEHRAIAEAFAPGNAAALDALLVAHMDDALRRLSAAQ